MSKTKLRRTISRVGYAPMSYDSETEQYSYGTVVWFPHNEAGGREFSAEANGESTEIYADGVSIYTSTENNGYNISLTLVRVTDDIDVAWLGNVVDDDGNVVEIANNAELPKFALFVVEDTTDGVGLTHVYYNCAVTTRPNNSGATSEGSGFDPQFAELSIAARPLPDTKVTYKKMNQQELFTTVPEADVAALVAASFTGATLDKPFRSDVTSYTLTPATGTTTGTIEVAAAIPTSTIVITAGSEAVENGGEISLTSETVITAVVTSGTDTKTYTFTVA